MSASDQIPNAVKSLWDKAAYTEPIGKSEAFNLCKQALQSCKLIDLSETAFDSAFKIVSFDESEGLDLEKLICLTRNIYKISKQSRAQSASGHQKPVSETLSSILSNNANDTDSKIR